MITSPYCRVTHSFSMSLGPVTLAHLSSLGYVGVCNSPVRLLQIAPAPTPLATATPPTAGLDFTSWSTLAASDEAVAIVYGASYHGASKLSRYLQVWRAGVLSEPLLLIDNYVDEYNEGDKCEVVWTGEGWLVSTRAKHLGEAEVLFQWISADGSAIEKSHVWARPEPWFSGASMVRQGASIYAIGMTDNWVDRRTIRIATLDVATKTLVSDTQGDGRLAHVDHPQIGLTDGAVEAVWYADDRNNAVKTGNAGIVSQVIGAAATMRAPKGGDLALGADARVLVTKNAYADLVALVRDEPTLLAKWDGLVSRYHASCASNGADWLACAVMGGVTHFWQLELTDEKPAPIEAPPPPPVPVPDNFGAIDEPLPDGTSFRMVDFVFGSQDFARTKDHDMAQVTRPEGRYLIKFGRGGAYELWGVDALGNVHHMEDMSAIDQGISQHFTSTLWCMETMKVGRQYGYQSPEHESVFTDVKTRQVIRREGFVREMWIWRGYAKFDCGPDLGIRRVVIMVYDNTGGAHTPIDVTDPAKMRAIELFIFAEGAGWIGWESHHSGRVYQTPTAQFNDYTRLGRSMFYRNGGKPVQPIPTGLATPISVEVPKPMKIPATEAATLKAFFAAFPVIPGDGSEAWADANLRYLPNGRMAMAAQQMAFSHGANWGQKRRGPGAPTSAGSIALKAPGGMHVWDIQIGAGTGRPTLNVDNAEYFWVTDQEWLAANPVNHIGAQQPRPGRAPWPAHVKHGVSGFDVAARVHGGDFSYYNETAPLPLNNFVYATIDNPQTHRVNRTFVEGMSQTEALCTRLASDNRRAMHVMLCGPANRDGVKLTRAQALDMIRQEVALFLRFPQTVLALCMGNELYQSSFEADFMLDPTFWDEVDALIPLQFPFAIGQVGESVVFGPGSVAMMHPDRGKGSAEALQILADAQSADGRTVVAREPARIELGGSGQSRGDINFVREELANAKRLGLPYFLHLAAGRGAYVPAMDDVQREALALIKDEAGAVVTPPPPPQPQQGSLLDIDMRQDHLWYPVFVTRSIELEGEIAALYRQRTGNVPALSDIRHNLWRGCTERYDFGTMRNAIENRKIR